MYGLARGLINNNPTNIRISSVPWRNKIVPSKDADFEQFKSAYDGLHAGATNVGNCYKFHGLSSVETIISRLSPPSENDTALYVAHVCERIGRGADDQLDMRDGSLLRSLVTAIIIEECGSCPYTDDLIGQAVDEYLGLPPAATSIPLA